MGPPTSSMVTPNWVAPGNVETLTLTLTLALILTLTLTLTLTR